jgi:hypothetical protein
VDGCAYSCELGEGVIRVDLAAYNRLMPVGEQGLLQPPELWPQETTG